MISLLGWQALLISVALGHITIVIVSIYLHRYQTHRSLSMHPALEHICRFWLWLTTGMVTKEWVAVHRKHHATTDEANDPHSPHHSGILTVLFAGAWLYARAANDETMVASYGVGTPNDWMEEHVYTPHHVWGVIIMFAIDITLFGFWGLMIWAIQMAWVPFWAAGVVNGLGHWVGYRNGVSKDHSRNLYPFAIMAGGEELHNNHHLRPANAKLSVKWWEFDIGWMYIKVLSMFGLIVVRSLE